MKSDIIVKPKKTTAPSRSVGLLFVESKGSGKPASDARERLAAFHAKYPLRTLKRGERGIVEGLKADRDHR